MESIKKYTIITGASQGLGKSFAELCAKKGRNLLLVSLPNEGIVEFAHELRSRFCVDVRTFELDLTNSSELDFLIREIKKYRLNMLINNAGVGGTKSFMDASLQYLDNIVLLNMRSLVLLTHQLLPQLKDENKAYILNISSLAAFVPMPFKTVYPASKAFVYSFSRGLQSELKESNVHVAVAHPGGMPTNEEVSKRICLYKGWVKYSILTPTETAEICLEKLFRKETIIIPGKINRLSSVLQRLIPVGFQLNLINSEIKKELVCVQ